MSKEYLEALAKNIRYKKEYIGNDTYRLYIKKNEIELLENYLTELEQIKNSNPSQALECLEEMWELSCDSRKPEYGLYGTIKNYILKSQEQEKVLDVIKKKKVNIDLLYASSSVEQYNDELVILYGMWFVKDRQLTEEEFDLLKRYCDEQDN